MHKPDLDSDEDMTEMMSYDERKQLNKHINMLPGEIQGVTKGDQPRGATCIQRWTSCLSMAP